MNMVKQKEGGGEEWKKKKKKMSFLVNFSKEFGDCYRKTFGEEVGHMNIIPCTQRGKQSDCLSGILDEYNDAEIEHKFLYFSLLCATSPGI